MVNEGNRSYPVLFEFQAVVFQRHPNHGAIILRVIIVVCIYQQISVCMLRMKPSVYYHFFLIILTVMSIIG
jgi:hypothetical protein